MDIAGLNIGNRIRMFREHAGWSLSDLAHHSGVSRSHLSQIERGDSSPTYKKIIQLCKAFACRPAALTDGLYVPTLEMLHLKEYRKQKNAMSPHDIEINHAEMGRQYRDTVDGEWQE